MTPRVGRFVVIGTLGFLVQLSVASVLLAAGLTPVLATLLAIEAAIVTNHAWHRRWAWRDRAAAHPWPVTLIRAHLGAGGTSLLLGGAVVGLLAGRVPPLLAQTLAVGLCAVLNFWLADRWVFARRTAMAFFALFLPLLLASPARADGPSAKALQSWDRYVSALEQARRADLTRGAAAWGTDADPLGTSVLAALRRGETVVGSRHLPSVEVDDATLEHWQGSVLLRGVTLAQVTERLRHPESYPQPPDVLKLHVAHRTHHGHDLHLRLTRSMLITATYDTWHQVRHEAVSAARVDSRSSSTRIDELADPGTPRERHLPLAQSRGFLWRMQSHWRFVATDDGVVVVCESITLSRGVPFGLGLVSRPLITRVARESMTTAVRAWQRW